MVDNTPPVIESFRSRTRRRAKRDPCLDSALVKFTARDATSSIERAQYSVDGGDWILVAPAGNISDALEERYEFTFGGTRSGRTHHRGARLRPLRQRRQRKDSLHHSSKAVIFAFP